MMGGFESWAWLSVASLGAWLAAFDKIRWMGMVTIGHHTKVDFLMSDASLQLPCPYTYPNSCP